MPCLTLRPGLCQLPASAGVIARLQEVSLTPPMKCVKEEIVDTLYSGSALQDQQNSKHAVLFQRHTLLPENFSKKKPDHLTMRQSGLVEEIKES
jgi:hypothetical protein